MGLRAGARRFRSMRLCRGQIVRARSADARLLAWSQGIAGGRDTSQGTVACSLVRSPDRLVRRRRALRCRLTEPEALYALSPSARYLSPLSVTEASVLQPGRAAPGDLRDREHRGHSKMCVFSGSINSDSLHALGAWPAGGPSCSGSPRLIWRVVCQGVQHDFPGFAG